MTSRQIQYIITTYEEGSISRAAQKLYVSQPALSQSIQLAERELGAPIFNRKTSPLQLTYAGERYLASARAFQSLELNLQHEIADIQQERSGWLRVGISMLRGAALLPMILPAFMKEYPRVEIKLFEKGSHAISSLVTQNVVDLAFVTTDHISQSKMAMVPLCREKTLLCAGPGTDLAQTTESGTPVSVRVLREVPFISIKYGHGIHEIQNKIFSSVNPGPQILFEVESAVMAMQLASSCNAMMLCPQIIMSALHNPSLSLYPILEEEFSRNLCLCYRHDLYLAKYMRDFIDLSKQCIMDHFEDAVI